MFVFIFWGRWEENVPIKAKEGHMTLEEDSHRLNSWDQFKTNSDLFNIEFTYQDEFYTTTLDHSKIDVNQRKKAEKIEKVIIYPLIL